jgi:hypothetical protein
MRSAVVDDVDVRCLAQSHEIQGLADLAVVDVEVQAPALRSKK